eukprot:TRINITY_DN7280_c0_g1_i1.p1 TRINITY_DN7280_c0_g1~~TRINITY_DN7280_c0_g1_i1.p1  ORF type:complete len:142 (-),score=31.55 TRINITY_DN7280_c0_g1_i1:28-453(-)
MTFDLVYASIPAALGLTYAPHFYKAFLISRVRKYDNVEPRMMYDSEFMKSPAAAPIRRAKAAHENGLENFPSFAAAILVTRLAGVPTGQIEPLAKAYLVCRALFNLFYIMGDSEKISFLRSLSFIAGLGITLRLMLLAAKK